MSDKANILAVIVTAAAGADPLRLDVRVRQRDGETRHEVTLRAADLARLGGDRSAAALVEAAFAFLLEREPKEAILRRFDISVIARYFPAFERELPRYFEPQP